MSSCGKRWSSRRDWTAVAPGTNTSSSRPAGTYHTAVSQNIMNFVRISCPRTNTPRENVEAPSAFQTSFLEAMLGELGRLSCLETRHGSFSTFRRRILRSGYIAWRIVRSGTLEGPAARPPLSLLICPCLSLLSTDYCLSLCCHTLHRCSLTVRTLCLRREEWDYDPPAVTTRNLVWY